MSIDFMKERAAQLEEARAFHLRKDLEDASILQQAKTWHEEADQLALKAADAEKEDKVDVARKLRLEAFALARRAADHCRQVNRQEPVSSYQRSAAHLALECGAFQEAVRLAGSIGRATIRGDIETQRKRVSEIEAQKAEIQDLAENVRQRLVGTRLNERTFLGGCGAFSADWRYLACAVSERHVQMYDVATGELLLNFEVEFKREPPADNFCRRAIADLCFSPDGIFIALASHDGSVIIWDRATRNVRHALAGHKYRVHAVAVSSDSRLLASAGSFGMKLWDPVTGKNRGTFANETNNYSVAFSPDGKSIAWGRGDGGRLTVLDIGARREVYSLRAHSDTGSGLAFSPCGRILGSAGGDGQVKLLEAENGREIVSLIDGDTSIIYAFNSLAFSPDGKLLATARGPDVLLWDLATYECLFAIPDTFPIM